MTNTATVADGSPERPFDVKDLGEVLMRRDKVPYGFFVSRALWDAIVARFEKESGALLAPAPQTFNGVRIVCDPSLPDTELNVAFTEEAWRKRLAELGRSD